MSLFPACRFSLLLDGNGVLTPGQRASGILVLTVPEHIPRTDHVDLLFESSAWAGYGNGKSRHVVRRTLFVAPLKAALPSGGLSAGEYRYPFTIEVPPNLPVAYQGADCGITHACNLRLDVDWAVDPTATMRLTVAPKPSHGVARSPIVVRSPARFHDEIALDVTLPSNVVVQGEPIDGTIALRTGHRADFGGVSIFLRHCAWIRMGRSEVRTGDVGVVHIHADRLRSGHGVPFRFPLTSELPPRSDNGSLELRADITVMLHAGVWTNPRFSIPIEVLARGSEMTGAGAAAPVGQSRLAVLATFLGARMGLPSAAPPALLQGAAGAVSFWLTDGSRGSEYAAIETYEFPNLHLGLRSRPAGLFTSSSPLAPAWLVDRHALQLDQHRGVPAPAVMRAFLDAVLDIPHDVVELQLSDHRLSFRRLLPSDDAREWLRAAEPMPERARRLAAAIASLPFGIEDRNLAEAWTATAREEQATLLAHVPAIVGIRRAVRTLAGEERTFVASLTTHWQPDDAPSTWMDIALVAAPLTDQAMRELASASTNELLVAARSRFPDIHATTPEHLIAVAPGLAGDPRTLLGALDDLVAWVLQARGERRVDAPYR